MRKYEETHPWITFEADLRRVPVHLWVFLGECQSKCEHIAGVPLRVDTARDLHRVYLSKGLHGTTAIEGNTLTEQQIRDLIDDKLELPPSQEYLKQEVRNIHEECNQLLACIAAAEELPLTPYVIKGFNRKVLDKLDLGQQFVPGETRKYSVGVGRYRGAPAEDCDYLLDRLCVWLTGFEAPGGMRTVYTIIKAVLAHLYLAWIHPFADGNGRTARLVEFQILIASRVPAPAAHLLSNHYNATRTEYYRQLDRASRSGGDVIPFLSYAVQGFLDGLREQLERIRRQQWDVAWRNYVYQHPAFHDKASETAKRRQQLVLDLSLEEKAVPQKRIPELTPRLARQYATKTDKTLSRDLNELCKIGLVGKNKDGYRAQQELMLAFLPAHGEH
jgi:Fic family protein